MVDVPKSDGNVIMIMTAGITLTSWKVSAHSILVSQRRSHVVMAGVSRIIIDAITTTTAGTIATRLDASFGHAMLQQNSLATIDGASTSSMCAMGSTIAMTMARQMRETALTALVNQASRNARAQTSAFLGLTFVTAIMTAGT